MLVVIQLNEVELLRVNGGGWVFDPNGGAFSANLQQPFPPTPR